MKKKEQDQDPLIRTGLAAAELPTPVRRTLEDRGGSPIRITMAVRSDLAPSGQFGEQWLIVDDRDLWVIERTENDANVRYEFPLDDITDAKVERAVGNGLFEVTVRDTPRVLLHYTNNLTEQFGAVAQYLHERAERGADIAVPEPDKNSNRCIYCGRPLVDSSAKVCPRCIERSKVLKRLMGLAKPYWGAMALLVGMLLAITLSQLAPPYLTRILIDDVLQGEGGVRMLTTLVLGLLGIRIVRVALIIGRRHTTFRIGAAFTAEMRQMLFDHVKNLPVEYFDHAQTGRLMTRVNTDTRELQQLFAELTMAAMRVMLIVGIGIALFAMSPRLGMYVLIPAPAVVVASYLYYKRMRPHFRRRWIARYRMNAMLNTFLQGIRVVKAFAQEARETERYSTRNAGYRDSILDVQLAWAKFFPLVSFAFSAGGLIIWYAGGRSVLEGALSLGTLMAFISYLGLFYQPLSNLTQVTQSLNRFVTISQRLFELLDEEPQAVPDRPVSKRELSGRIEFDNVTFGYEPFQPVIRDLSFAIQPGELVGVVGHSGAGKSTLINLVCRFYDVDHGAIRIDGVDLRELSMAEIRQHIGVVLQQPYLFRGTIAANISYGRPDATRDEIIAAAKAANCHDFVTMMPEGYDTIVNEGGGGLSGGERQRISIARAILNNPSILILDEATSSVDTETERQIQEALDVLVQGRTTIAIAHRLSTLSNADRIVVMDHGRIEEIGPPDELMERQGAFYDLVQMQNQFTRYQRAAGF